MFGSCRGSFAEYASARADKLMHKPIDLTLEHAAAITVSGAIPDNSEGASAWMYQ